MQIINQNKILSETQLLINEKAMLLHFLESAPPGKLCIRSRDSSRTEYYHRIPRESGKASEVFIPKSNLSLASALAQKEYAMKRIKEIDEFLTVTEKYLELKTKRPLSLDYLENEKIRCLMNQNPYLKNDKFRDWQFSSYKRKSDHPEGLKYPTVLQGLFVRSKSEANIVSRLVHFEIPFHYEEAYSLNGILYFPDFKCINRSTEQFVWLEHLGMADNFEYMKKASGKIASLSSGGLIPGKNLLITTETLDQPLDIQWVDELIQYFLL